jgi:NADPH:quinone reductase-like Zn-dependent oxidoreductase
MGVVQSDSSTLGIECTGIIKAVGPGVTDLQLGDRVLVMGAGCFSTRLVTSQDLCIKMPESLSFSDGATMPCVYSTVIYALVHIARLSAEQVRSPLEIFRLALN